MTDRLGAVFRRVKWAVDLVVDPLRKDEEPTKFDLGIPEAHTTTIDGDTGWGSRPPAVVTCARCGADVFQRAAHDDIDCPRCVATFEHGDFGKLELKRLQCPVCGQVMDHGRRHPNVFDVPEWATCNRCRYHWEFAHTY